MALCRILHSRVAFRSLIREEMARFFHEIAAYVEEKEMEFLREEIGRPEDYSDEDLEVVEH